MDNLFDKLLGEKRNIIITSIACAVVVFQVLAIFLTGGAGEKSAAGTNGAGGAGSQGGAAATTAEPQHPDTAYFRILPATGDNANEIGQFVTWERGVMKEDEVVMSFTGDCTLGTWPEASSKTNFTAVFDAAGSPTYPFDRVRSIFENDDYTYINLETTLTKATTRLNKGNNYNFKGDPEWGRTMLAASSIEGCNLSNNHSYDYKKDGYDETKSSLASAGIDVGTDNDVIVTKLGDLEVVLLSANYISTSYNPSDVFGSDLTSLMIKQIKQYKRDDNIVIVSCHWGLERRQDANGDQCDPAHKLIDAGADMIIGHHPHTIQGVELYKGKYICYSLGNFSFGGKGDTDEINRVSLIARPRFALRDGKSVVTGISFIPCYTTSTEDLKTNNYQPTMIFGAKAYALIQRLKNVSAILPNPCKDFDAPSCDFGEESSTDDTDEDEF